MTSLHHLRNRLLDSGAGRGLCRALGVDAVQYRVLLDLFDTLVNRMEVMGMVMGLNRMTGWYAAASVVLSVTAFVGTSLGAYLSIMIVYTLMLMSYVLVMDATQTVVNPDEASVLAHLPIGGATYVGAKLTHLAAVVGLLVPALNLVPALAGLAVEGSRWYYPLTHMLAAYAAGFFVALLVCGLFGWLFLVVPPRKLKNTILGLHVMILPASLAINALLRVGEDPARRVLPGFLRSSWMPWNWFVAIGLTGHGQPTDFSLPQAALAVGLLLAAVGFGLRAFRRDYLIRASALMEGSAGIPGRSRRASPLQPLVRTLTGAPSGFGAFAFLATMMRRDWSIRRQALPVMIMWVLYPLFLAFTSLRRPPAITGGFSIQGFSPMHALPHLLGIAMIILAPAIAYTAEPRGSAMFVPLPFTRFGPFVRGMALAIFFPVAAIHLLLLGPCIGFWGIGWGMLFIGFSLVVCSLYLDVALLLIEGFPFAAPADPSSGAEFPMVLIFAMVPIAGFALLQWLVFHHAILVLGTGIVLVLLSLALGRFSLGRLEQRLRARLKLLGIGAQPLFRQADGSGTVPGRDP